MKFKWVINQNRSDNEDRKQLQVKKKYHQMISDLELNKSLWWAKICFKLIKMCIITVYYRVIN